MTKAAYNTRQHKTASRAIQGRPCWQCGQPATHADHQPPLTTMPPGQWQGTYRPHCTTCSSRQGARIRNNPASRPW